MSYETKDSGQRESFDSGAVRDVREGKGRYDLISFLALGRIAGVYERGAAKYDDRNWEKGMPISRTLDSALRHIGQYLVGEDDEDHLAQAAWNLIAALHFDEGIRRGFYPSTLDDRPGYAEQYPSEAVATYTEHAEREFGDPQETLDEILGPPKRYAFDSLEDAKGCPCAQEPKPMKEVQYSSIEQWKSQTVLHDHNHSKSEGSYHYHEGGNAFECMPADLKSRPHKHARNLETVP